ncbi:MAG: hypothetical protein LBP22_15365 [Deltaproteobacteria bacterium]|jgi:hypothetical protein|nr:hypothetical protein [Deltaproteobacteria bacterium]
MQTAIVAVILLAAAGITIYRVFFRPSCGCGCGGKKHHNRPLTDDPSMECECCGPDKPQQDS